jgi:3',5'-cyclic AMP phosphodiesterase CpdA
MQFKFAHMTDSHLYAPEIGAVDTSKDSGLSLYDAFYMRAVEECVAHDIDFIVNTGDLVNGSEGFARHKHFKCVKDAIFSEMGSALLCCAWQS